MQQIDAAKIVKLIWDGSLIPMNGESIHFYLDYESKATRPIIVRIRDIALYISNF